MNKLASILAILLASLVGCADLDRLPPQDDGPDDQFPPTSTTDRVTAGLQLLYDFKEGGGDSVADISGVGDPHDLIIADPGLVTWMPGGGINLTSPTIITTLRKPNKLYSACVASNAITLEAWVRPASVIQEDARIVTFSEDTQLRNFTLEQQQTSYRVRLRTTGTDENGTPATVSENDSLTGSLQHVVYTRDPIATRFYVDGELITEDVLGGDFSGWDSVYQLAIGNEITEDRPFRGEIYLVSTYCRVLSPLEVAQNFEARF